MLTGCFDGSGKDGDPSARFITLAGFAAEEDGWEWLNRVWRRTLNDHPRKPSYSHMAEMIHRRGEFRDWTEADMIVLVTGLSLAIAEVHRNCMFQGFRFTIDNVAHQKWSPINSQIPPISRNLAVGVFLRALRWYAETLPQKRLVQPIVLLFDRGEPYLNVVLQEWRSNARSRRTSHLWALIRDASAVEMSQFPGIQAADMLAWSINRVRTSGTTDWAGQIAQRILALVPHVWNEVEDSHMRRIKLPGET